MTPAELLFEATQRPESGGEADGQSSPEARTTESLRADEIGVSFPHQDRRVEIFRDVSLDVPRGTTLGIFGPNGTGKTTLLRGVAGLIPVQGAVTYPGPRSNSARTIGCIPQGVAESFYPWASLETNILLHLPHPIKQNTVNRRTVRDTHDLLGLKLDLSRKPTECSGGMLQQAALIRAFARRPDVVVADEPFSALDFDVAGRVREGFSKVVRELGICALLVLHSIEDLVEVCDSVLAIPGRPFTTNPQLSGYARAETFVNRARPPQGQGKTLAHTMSPFVAAVRKAVGVDLA
jgi:ABC-type nitrate/sulfonate/bicarbonate transport system ATPase subunit